MTTRHIGVAGLGSAMAILIAIVFSVAGCGSIRSHRSTPKELVDKATIPGMPHIRTWGDRVSDGYRQSLAESIRQRQAYFAAHPEIPKPATADILAISGGGENGAFGAGLLNGWTAAGNRPEFRMVTGISTGALIAPLAFLGPQYDQMLKEGYTRLTKDDILEKLNILAFLDHDSLASSKPLAKLLEKWIDKPTLAAIAAEHAKGRRLFIATVNLEAQRPVIWDMGAIAASGEPHALKLFREVMLASASIPGAFPPVYINVEAEGQNYTEMHVDGGTISQVFLWGGGVSLDRLAAATDPKQAASRPPIRLFVIRNGRFDPEYQSIHPLVFNIGGRAVSTLIKTQGISDAFRLYQICQRDGMEFNLAAIPSAFNAELKEPFDKIYMNKLYDCAYDMAINGYPWQKTPPYFEEAAQ